MLLNGLRIIESEWLTEPGEPVTVRRTWQERLFSRPWRPLKATKTVVPQIPYRGAFKLDNGVIVMHPATARAMVQRYQNHVDDVIKVLGDCR